MTIDREQLISLLAERTGFDQGRVNEQFVELIDRIQQAEQEKNTLDIEGFGMFKGINDRLKFEPAEVFETEINSKYTGMKPIELIGAFKEPEGDGVPIADLPDEEEVLDYKDLPEEQQQLEEAEPEPSDAEPEEQPELAKTAEEGSDEAQEAEDKTALDKDEAAEEKKVQAETADKPEPVAATDESEDEDPLGKAILILAIILALAVAGWMAYDLGLFDGNSESDGAVPEPVEEQTESVGELSSPNTPEQSPLNGSGSSNNVDASVINASAGSEEITTENNETAAPPVEDTPYGLYGEFNESISTGYFTIVLHSLRTMDLAEEKKQVLVDEGFRAKIDEASVNDQTYYRVGVGQFTTVKEAQQAVEELPEPYKSNNFINRF